MTDTGRDDGTESPTESRTDEERPLAERFEHRERHVEYETPWYTGGYDLLTQPDGTEKRYYWADLPAAVVVVPVVDGEVVLVEQYRPTIGETHIELPAGIVEDGESYTEAGARELAEETGFDPQGTSLLQELWVATGVLRHRRGYVFAEGLSPVEPARDTNEFLAVRTVPVEDAIDEARAPPANDATLQGLQLAETEGLLDGAGR